jgi:energy-coupling factor transport system permease protein
MIHPGALLGYFAGLFALNFMYPHPVFHGTVCVGTFLLAFYYGGLYKMGRLLRLGFLTGVCIVLLNICLNHRGSHLLFYFLGNPVTLEAAVYGVHAGLLMMTMMAGFLSFNALLDQQRFLYLFAKILPKIALILHMAMRYTGVFGQKARELTEIQKLRGTWGGPGKWRHRIRRSAMLLTALAAWNLEEGMETALVLKARGYGRGRRSAYALYAFTGSDAAFLAVSAGLTGMLVLARERAQYAFYPALAPVNMSINQWLTWGMLAAYLGLPLVLELAAAVKRGIGVGTDQA